MTKEIALSLLRSAFTLLGSYLIGKNVFGIAVDQSILQIVIGSVLTLGSTLWGIFDKSLGADQLASALRSIVISVGSILVGSGKLSSAVWEQVSAIVVTLIPILLSQLSKVKVAAVAAGTVVPQSKTLESGATVFTGKLVKPKPAA